MEGKYERQLEKINIAFDKLEKLIKEKRTEVLNQADKMFEKTH